MHPSDELSPRNKHSAAKDWRERGRGEGCKERRVINEEGGEANMKMKLEGGGIGRVVWGYYCMI